MRTSQPMWVTFRRMNSDGTNHHSSREEVYVTHNSRTGRYVVPVLLQEGETRVNVRKLGDELIVEVTR